MHFPFSFVFSVPGMVNPFAPTSQARGNSKAAEAATMNGTGSRPVDIRPDLTLSRRRPPSPTTTQSQLLSRKRGWVPAVPEPSMPTTIPAFTGGYLDTPARYREFSETPSRDEVDMDEMIAEIPPPKRRRTLAGSIVSTALSAALIGTAVGLTVYRLWRGRGKQPEALPPPPPYEQGEWVPPSTPDSSDFSDLQIVNHTPLKSRKPRHVAGRRSTQRLKKATSRPQFSHSTSLTFSSPARPSIPPESEFSAPEPFEPVGEADDQMDWMSSQLAKLIEEGKRALQKEVVVMSETKEDEEDDGSGLWEDDSHIPSSSSGTLRRHKRARHATISSPPPSYVSPQTTPRKNRYDSKNSYQTPSSPRRANREASNESTRSRMSLHQRNDEPWQSPELRESMERARRRIMEQRNHAS